MLQKYNRWAVLRVFFDNPEDRFSLQEISRRTGLAPTSVKCHLLTLERQGLVRCEKRRAGTRIFPTYAANAESKDYRRYRMFDVIERLHASGLIQRIIDEASPGCIILFGSAGRGEDIAGSDIDLYVLAKKKGFELKSYERQLKRRVELHFNEQFRSYPKELRNSIANGIKVYGILDVV